MAEEEMVTIDLLPVEYEEAEGVNGTKIFICSRCQRVFSMKLGPTGVKDHIFQVHVPSGEVVVRKKVVPVSKVTIKINKFLKRR